MEVNVKYCRQEGDFLFDPSMYRQLVGSLNYLTITRPDISYAVQQVSQFMQAPTHLHLSALRRIIRYLQGTISRGLFFPVNSSILLCAYSDADWASCSNTRRSVTVWIRGILGELGFPQIDPTPLHADNTSAIQIAANPVFREHTKHIEVDYIFTKALSRHRHQFLIGKLMLSDHPPSI
ncbi:uncharacterized mitochondrial protein AtMg00240-like [Mercurialis annua]|uniref:uncharacterized mitochondrial protein AtMg00240-like n=1 Tax=Mercurialis annua TaxID=3986 RepID=UPI00215F1B19|nr:uncharacterized mitochondrial protein AtMg00240-like [Mercurialis annua]